MKANRSLAALTLFSFVVTSCGGKPKTPNKPDVPSPISDQVLVQSKDLPDGLEGFDTVFSMGVLYHRRSPFDHLLDLRGCLKPGGQLVLETLVIDGDEGQVLVPPGRYARMPNVWFLPTCNTLESWLGKSGYTEIRLVDLTATSIEEQRSTSWMQFESLPEALDPQDPSRTVEGHPAPKRAFFVARKPG